MYLKVFSLTGLIDQTDGRETAASLIGSLAGRSIPYDSVMSKEKLQQEIEAWLKWWNEEGRNQPLNMAVISKT